jgi:hypothetical protein
MTLDDYDVSYDQDDQMIKINCVLIKEKAILLLQPLIF